MSQLEAVLSKALESCRAAYAAIRTGHACGDAQEAIVLVEEALQLAAELQKPPANP